MNKHNGEVNESNLPQVTVVYDFLNEINTKKSGVTIENRMELQSIKKVLTEQKSELRDITICSDTFKIDNAILQYDQKYSDIESIFRINWIKDFHSKLKFSGHKHEYYRHNSNYGFKSVMLQSLM